MLEFLYRTADRLRDARRRQTWDSDLASGRRGEDLAHRFLRWNGYTIVARNYRPPHGGGELDIVAWHGATLVFVEVKTRATADFGDPAGAVGDEKQRRLLRVARDYARRAGVDWQRVRFDVVSVLDTQPPQLELNQDAFAPVRRVY